MNFVRKLYCKTDDITNYSSPEWRKIGKVVELNLYPLLEGKPLSVNRALCTKEGLEYQGVSDWNFMIYDFDKMEVCTAKIYPDIAKIEVSCNEMLSIIEVRTTASNKIQLNNFVNIDLHHVIFHENEMFFIKDCGEDAAKWVSNFLTEGKIKLRLGLYEHCGTNTYYERYENYLIECPQCKSYPFSTHLESKNRFVLLNTVTFKNIKNTVDDVKHKITASNFYPNIIIETEGLQPFSEFNWKDIKIGNSLFERIASCRQCTAAKVDACFKDSISKKINFYDTLKKNIKVNMEIEENPEVISNFEHELENRKYPSFRKPDSVHTPNLTIDFKFVDDIESSIHSHDSVYIRI